MKWLASILILFCLSASARTWTTSFPATENPISEAGLWVNGGTVGLDWTDVRTTGGTAIGTVTGNGTFDDSIAIIGGSWASSQSVTGVVHIGASRPDGSLFPEVELLLRFNITANSASGYEFLFSAMSGSGCYVKIVRWNGDNSDFTYLGDGVTGSQYVVNDGDELVATASGSTLTAYIRGTQVLQVTDSTFTTGSPGVGFFCDDPTDNTQYGFHSLTAGDGTVNQILPNDRIGPWVDGVGIQGGIPNSSNMTIYTTVAAGASISTINTAIANCPSNQVVQLSAGAYNLASHIIGKNGVVIRGAGMTNTTIAFSGSDGGIYIGSGSDFYNSLRGTPVGLVNWTAGYAQGSSNLTFSSVSGLSVGMVVTLDQLNDAFFINNVGYEGASDSGRGASSLRILEQYCEVKAINGSVVTVWPPVAAPFWASGLSPQAWWMAKSSWVSKAGVEDLSIDVTGTTGQDSLEGSIAFDGAMNCWVKNVKGINAHRCHVGMWGSFRVEVRHCYFYATQNSASQSYGIECAYTGSLLAEDNIFDKVTSPIMVSDGVSMCVFGYNYMTNHYYTPSPGALMASVQTHRSHATDILFEGNHGTVWDADFIHGSSSHNTAFRNRFTGWEAWSYGGGQTTDSLRCEQIDLTNRWMSSVGNILGTAGKYSYYESIPSSKHANAIIYKVGVNTGGGYAEPVPSWPDDTISVLSFHRHMDYDTVTAGITYNATNQNVTLPASLYLSSKPDFFGSMSWPPYNPTNVTASAMSYTNIPAGYRAVYGELGPSAASITVQPQNQAVQVGQNATFTVTAIGDPTITYQWKLSGSDISGATTSAYATNSVVLAANGNSYTVGVSNSIGGELSSAATLTVTNAPATTTTLRANTVRVGTIRSP